MRIKTFRKRFKPSLFQFLVCVFRVKKQTDNSLRINELKRVLLVRQDNRIGNILFMTALVELIFKQTRVKSDVLVSRRFSSILADYPHVNRIIAFDHKTYTKHPRQFKQLITQLNYQRYDLIIDCKTAFSFTNALLTLLINAKVKIGTENKCSHLYLNHSLGADQLENRHESQNIIKPFVSYFNLKENIIPMSYVFKPGLESVPLIKASQCVGIHIGGRNVKSLTTTFINSLTQKLAENNIKTLLIYGPNEKEKINLVEDRENTLKINPHSVNELARVINSINWFICPDTGPLHIASALNKNIIALFNNNNAVRYGPLTKGQAIVIDTYKHSEDIIINKMEKFIVTVNSKPLSGT